MSKSGVSRIGPGTLVVVVGPSGAGKDTLIALTRAQSADDPKIVFPRRIVTREASSAEEHDSVSSAQFDAARLRGDYAFSWEAHGLKYALPASVNIDLSAGRTVLCNVSRGVIGMLREHYARLIVVLVTAPREILLARLAKRGREDDRDMGNRLERELPEDFSADIVIENVDDPRIGARRLLEVLRDGRAARTALSKL